MPRRSRSATLAAILALVSTGFAPADPPKEDASTEGFRTVESAIKRSIDPAGARLTSGASPAYLGVVLGPGGEKGPVVAGVDPDSPASRAGVESGDVLRKIDGREVKDEEVVLGVLGERSAGETVAIELSRGEKSLVANAVLVPWSRVKSGTGRPRVGFGARVAASDDGNGLKIEEVAPGSAADRARLKVGEVLLKIDGVSLTGPDQLQDLIDSRPPDGAVVATLRLAEKAVDLKIPLGGEPRPDDRPTGQGGPRGGYWTKPGFRLAIICVEYPDAKHNPKITREAWEDLLFSEGTYTKTNVTGQAVHGSFVDYFLEQSCGRFRPDGKVFDWIEVSKKRAEYATGNRTALLTESLDRLLERDGKEALKGFDGVFFLYAGARFPAPRGSLYWPHRSSISHDGRRWPYFIVEEGGSRMQGLSVLCHEFGHMLGLPDLYARPENPGMEGLGAWCNMSTQPNRMIPEHFGPWVKEKLGWLDLAVIDPGVKQKLVLAPIEKSPKECFKVLIRPDGSEYLLLENRRKTGFDKGLPSEGLLIWHVLRNRPTLMESHGIEGPSGPRVFLGDVPYPSGANDAYTPYTTPSSRSPLGGGPPVFITNIRRLADGRVAFQVGYDYE